MSISNDLQKAAEFLKVEIQKLEGAAANINLNGIYEAYENLKDNVEKVIAEVEGTLAANKPADKPATKPDPKA